MSHKSTPVTAITCAPVTRHMCPVILESTPAKPASFWNVLVAAFLLTNFPCAEGHTAASQGVGVQLWDNAAKPLHAISRPPSPDTRPHWIHTCTSGFVSFPDACGSALDIGKSKMHKPHSRPLRKETCMHLAVDSSTSRIAHQQPRSVPSRGHIGPSGHNGSLVILNSANFCMSSVPHFTRGPMSTLSCRRASPDPKRLTTGAPHERAGS